MMELFWSLTMWITLVLTIGALGIAAVWVLMMVQ
jgi:hypothetical protein